MKKEKIYGPGGKSDGYQFKFDKEEVEEILTEHLIEKEDEDIPKEEVDCDCILPSEIRLRIRRKHRK